MAEFRNIEEKVIKSRILKPVDSANDLVEDLRLFDENMDFASGIDMHRAARIASELGAQIRILKETSENYAFRPLFSDRGILSAPAIFVKRVIRKLIKWYIEPICFQQSVFNAAVTNSIERISEMQLLLLASISEQDRRKSTDDNQPKQEEV